MYPKIHGDEGIRYFRTSEGLAFVIIFVEKKSAEEIPRLTLAASVKKNQNWSMSL